MYLKRNLNFFKRARKCAQKIKRKEVKNLGDQCVVFCYLILTPINEKMIDPGSPSP